MKEKQSIKTHESTSEIPSTPVKLAPLIAGKFPVSFVASSAVADCAFNFINGIL